MHRVKGEIQSLTICYTKEWIAWNSLSFLTKNGLTKLIGICAQNEQQNNILKKNLLIGIWLLKILLNNRGEGSITMKVIFIQNRLIV